MSFLEGRTVREFMEAAISVVPAQFACVWDVESIGWRPDDTPMPDRTQVEIGVRDLLNAVQERAQLIWGTFLFCEDWGSAHRASAAKSILDALRECQFSIRTVDGEYIYLQTPYEEQFIKLRELTGAEETKCARMDELDFPF